MTELQYQYDGNDGELLLEGLALAASQYTSALSRLDPECFTRETGPTAEERRTLLELNTDVIVPDVLKLTEDSSEIRKTDAYLEAEKRGFCEDQYVFDVSVGEQVALNLHAVTNIAEARALLPDKTIAIFEVNANRGFPRGNEDNGGCYGLPQGWLGHVIVDAYYKGDFALRASHKQEERSIDYLGEPKTWTTDGSGLERNAARIRIRPAYPLIPSDCYGAHPRDVFELRTNPEAEASANNGRAYREYGVLRGEYRICRAVSLLHDLTDWSATDFESKEEALARARANFSF